MPSAYKIKDNSKPHYITLTTVAWVDVFTRPIQKEQLVDSLNYCQKEKGLLIYSWCLMSNHLHMICKAENESIQLTDILRDFKAHTSKQIIRTIQEEPESRRAWMLDTFKKACVHLKRDQHFKVWQNGYHGLEIYSQRFLEQKLNYIHNNPVKARIVQHPEDYLFSSARNYAGLDSLLPIAKI